MVAIPQALVATLFLIVAGRGDAAEGDFFPKAMSWAYLYSKNPHDLPSPADTATISVPGSSVSYTWKELTQSSHAPDWFPSEHPPMPDVVAKDWSPKSIPCAECHWPNGLGHLATATLAGLPEHYIAEQLAAFRGGLRHATSNRASNVKLMIQVAGEVDASQAAEAARYYAGLPAKAWVRVVETDRVPRTLINRYGWRDLDPAGGTEPIGPRIIEVAEDEQLMNSADSHSGIVAYVPRGSVQRGKSLVAVGVRHAPACASCHGPELRGLGNVPRVAGQMPTYLARQMWDIKTGSRGGDANLPMLAVATQLKPADILSIAAYLASCEP